MTPQRDTDELTRTYVEIHNPEIMDQFGPATSRISRS